jgi:hypothetical protein
MVGVPGNAKCGDPGHFRCIDRFAAGGFFNP